MLNIYGNKGISEASFKHIECPSSHHIQKYLAKYMTELIHGSELANQVERFSEILFSRESLTSQSKFDFNILLDKTRFKTIFRSNLLANEITVLDLLKRIFPDYSNNQLKTMIKSGGLKFNHTKITDMNQKIRQDEMSDYLLLNYGKAYFYVVKIED